MTQNISKKRVLFICLGNICRSPAAHAIFQKMIDDAGLSDHFLVDSAGIGNWHVGELPDKRMRDHGYRRGYRIDHHARQFKLSDFDNFDQIIVMDDDNYRIITGKAGNDEQRRKVVKMVDYLERYAGEESVPDPYYGGADDFEWALDLIEDGCRGLLKHSK